MRGTASPPTLLCGNFSAGIRKEGLFSHLPPSVGKLWVGRGSDHSSLLAQGRFSVLLKQGGQGLGELCDGFRGPPLLSIPLKKVVLFLNPVGQRASPLSPDVPVYTVTSFQLWGRQDRNVQTQLQLSSPSIV